MKQAPWFVEFHRRWQAARGRSHTAATRPYGLNWTMLLESVGITDVEGQKDALRDAERMETEGRLVLKRHRYRHYLIDRVILPLSAEPWLRSQFGGEESALLLDRALAVLDHQEPHELHPDRWTSLIGALRKAFVEGQTVRPFTWRDPAGLADLLGLMRGLTSGAWPPGIPVRSLSAALGRDSKFLERRQRSLSRALSLLLARPTTLEDLGVVMSESMLLMQGPLVLHFNDGECKDFTGLSPYALSHADLERAIRVETGCMRLLTIENAKTTFRQFAAADPSGTTMLVASSFPTRALEALLRKLPIHIEHHHFGDTDPYGFLILQKIRHVSPRSVLRFRMEWRASDSVVPLSSAEVDVLDRLLEADELQDCHEDLFEMRMARSKGQFEQETIGPPQFQGWPFFLDL